MDTPRHPIPAALARRAEAVELAAPRRDSPGYDDVQDEASAVLRALSEHLLGDAELLREVIPPGMSYAEAAWIVASQPDCDDVQAWLAAARWLADEDRDWRAEAERLGATLARVQAWVSSLRASADHIYRIAGTDELSWPGAAGELTGIVRETCRMLLAQIADVKEGRS